METRLPLKFQVALRDYWYKETAAPQAALKTLSGTLGNGIDISPEWPLLLAELGKAYEDSQDLVRAVAGSVEIWCKVLNEVLEKADQSGDAAQIKWVDTLLEKLQLVGKLRVFILADDEPGTAWSDSEPGFVLKMPKTTPAMPAEFAAIYQGDFQHCFDEKKPIDLAHRPAGSDDWADVEMDSATGTAAVVNDPASAAGSSKTGAGRVSEYLPSAESLPSPDVLLRRPPYYLTVFGGNSPYIEYIEIHSSHSASLELLHAYLKRWCRTNHQNVRGPPIVDISLKQSCWGTSLIHDRLILSTMDSRPANVYKMTVPMILAFVESVLGYQRLSLKPGWVTYRRDVPFK